MKRRILSVLMALALCLGLLPGTAWAEEEDWPEFYREVIIGGVQANKNNHMDLFEDGTVSVAFEKVGSQEKWIVTLNHANLTNRIFVKYGSFLDIVLVGDNSITVSDPTVDGIMSFGNLTIKGSGSLTINVRGNDENVLSSAVNIYGVVDDEQFGSFPGNVTIEENATLVLNGYSNALTCDGRLEIIDSDVTAVSPFANSSRPVLYGKGGVTITRSHVSVTNTGEAIGISSGDWNNISITDSTVHVESTDVAISLWDELTISNSEVTACSQTSNALYASNGISVNDSTITAKSMDGYPAIYTDGAFQISDSTVKSSSVYWTGLHTQGVLTVNGDSDIDSEGGGCGLIANGGLTMNGGSLHAKGNGYPAVCITQSDEAANKNDYTLDTSRIHLVPGLGEISGGKPAVSEWYESGNGNGLWSFMTSFIAPNEETLEAGGTNALSEVTIRYIEADYTAVDAAIAKIPSDLSAYTSESVGALENAKNAVIRDLSFAEQERVDGFAAAIEAAIAGLTEKSSSGDDTPSDPGGDIPYFPSAPSTPSTPNTPSTSGTSLPVTTTGQNSPTAATTTTAAPSSSASDGAASAVVDASMGDEIVRQAVDNNSETVVIAPQVTGDVAKTEVSIPAATVGQIGSQTSASLTVSTPVAGVTIPNGGLGSLASAGGTVTVAAEKAGNTVELSVTAGGRTVEHVPGGLTLTVPASSTTPGTVAVLLREDGTREVVRKSVADGGSVTVPLDGSARLEIVDNGKQFADVPAGSWAADAAAFVSAHELFSGTAPDRFDPDKPMSRGMLAVVLHNLEGNPFQAVTNEFADVDGGAWYAQGVAWAAARSIIGGYGNGRFGPNDNITREQLAVILWRYAGSPAATDQALNFTDADRVSGWALDALRWAVENGVLSGKGGGILDPQGYATRAETAHILKNFMERQ